MPIGAIEVNAISSMETFWCKDLTQEIALATVAAGFDMGTTTSGNMGEVLLQYIMAKNMAKKIKDNREIFKNETRENVTTLFKK